MSEPDVRSVLSYLTDHAAGPSFAIGAAERCRDHADDPALASYLESFVHQIDGEREVLHDVIHALGGTPSLVKKLGAWAAQKAARVKLTALAGGYDDLSRFEELELIRLGVQGKRGMWLFLKQMAARDSRLERFGLAALVTASDEQIERLEHFRLEVGSRLAATPRASTPAATSP